jgi:hypothetical protein
MQSKKVTSNSEKNRLAEEVIELWVSFQMALSSKRKYPAEEFTSSVASARRYLELIGRDPLIHREVVNAMNGLVDFLSVERKRVPGTILYEAERLECLFFAGYDPNFEGDEPPDL